jgi:hypothetical protein
VQKVFVGRQALHGRLLGFSMNVRVHIQNSLIHMTNPLFHGHDERAA